MADIRIDMHLNKIGTLMESTTPSVNDCRECPNFLWDFEAGRFLCERARDRKVEDLHLIPDWCPQAETIWTKATSASLDAACY